MFEPFGLTVPFTVADVPVTAVAAPVVTAGGVSAATATLLWKSEMTHSAVLAQTAPPAP